MEFIGIDLHLKTSYVCFLNDAGEKTCEMTIPTTKSALKRHFETLEPARIIIEAGSYSLWVNRLLSSFDHKVIVANPRKVRLIAESTLKNDRVDAEVLARLGRSDPHFLCPITPRGPESQLTRGYLKVRAALVKTRTLEINSVRGLLRSWGFSFSAGYPAKFCERVLQSNLPSELLDMVTPLIESILAVQAQIANCEQELKRRANAIPTVRNLMSMPGIGPIISLAFFASIDQPERFPKSRQIGSYLGFRPSLRESGGKRRMGPISKEGDQELRALLVQGAYSLMRSQKESALKEWATKLGERIGRKKAIVALARKMGVILHHLWITGQPFQPFPQAS